MSWLSSLIGGGIAVGQQIYQNEYNKKEAEKNRQFQSDEAAINRQFQSDEAALQRDWSAAEAERARDWNEEMYYKYNSLAGKVAQAQEAGVNPMFAVTGNAVSPMSTNSGAPSGASAGSVGTPSGASATSAFVDIVGSILGMSKLKAEVENIKADTKQKESQSDYTSWLSRLSEREYNIITEFNFDVQKLEAEIGLTNEQANLAFQQAGKLFEEAGKIAEERGFLSRTSDDRVKIVEYDRLMAEFENGLPASIEALSSGKKAELTEIVGAVLKALLLIKN